MFKLFQTRYKFLIITLIIFGLYQNALFSQRIQNSNPFEYAGIYNLSPNNLEGYVTAFYYDFYANNPSFQHKDFVKLSLETYDVLKTKIYFKNIEENLREEETNILAIAWGMDDNCRVEIQVDGTNWMKADNVRRLWVIYHELAHDIFNIEHGQGGPLMAPSIPSFIDETLFLNAKNQLMRIVARQSKLLNCDDDFNELDSIINN